MQHVCRACSVERHIRDVAPSRSFTSAVFSRSRFSSFPFTFCSSLANHHLVVSQRLVILLILVVLYLYIYIAHLAVRTIHKRFQCKRPWEKRAVLREKKEALGLPVNKVDCVEGGSWFQSAGPMICKGPCLSHKSPCLWDKEIMMVKWT